MTLRRLRRRLAFALVFASALLAFSLGVSSPARSQGRTISLNQKRVDITTLIKQVGEATERTILFDDSVRGAVSIIAKRPVQLNEAWSMLESSLSVRGFSLLPSTEGIWRVAKIADAVGEAPFSDRIEGQSDSYVTSLIPLRIASTEAVMSVVEPLAGASVTLVPFSSTNSLIASGPERRIARLTTIADAIDRVDESPIRFRVIRYRGIDEIAGWVEAFFDSGKLSRNDVEIWTDERTNSLIFRANEADEAVLYDLLERFDRPIEGEGQIRILRVLNRDAEEVAEIIRSVRDSSGNSPTSRASPAAIAALRARNLLADSDFSIAVDNATRSLVVRAEEDAHREIRRLLEEIDQTPQQIAVDLKVTEVRTPSAFTLGFAFTAPIAPGDDEGEIIGRIVSTPGGTGLAASPGPETTLFSRVDQELNLPFTIDDGTGIAIPISNTAVITAGDLEARTQILIEPSLVLTTGDAHEIFVGDNVPIPVQGSAPTLDGDATNTTTNANVLTRQTTIERRDIGIRVGIEARAGKVGPIALDLDVEISALTPSLAGVVELVGPTFSEQSFLVNARLRDGEAAIVAINRDRRTTKIRQGTPFLSSLPLLGWLFTNVTEREEDTHLVLAAKVRRIASPAELAADTIRRRLAFERRQARERALPEVEEGESVYAVLVTTRGLRNDADAIAQSLDLRGFATEIHRWTLADQELFDVYVTALDSMSDAAAVASTLNREGWEADLTLLPTRS